MMLALYHTVLRNPPNLDEETSALYNLKEAFTESNMPIRVDVMDWARIPASFHREIELAHVMVQDGVRMKLDRRKLFYRFSP